MKPIAADAFIGKTHRIARLVLKDVPLLQSAPPDPLDRCYLFTGTPGTGKTTLALAMAQAVAAHPLAVEHKNGQSVSVDVIRQWEDQSHYRPLYGLVNVKVIDEIDGMKADALGQARTWLDTLPPRNVVIATTNKAVDQLQEQLQSRFQVFYFERIPAESIAALLVKQFNLALHHAQDIAKGAGGNVRSALIDARVKVKALAMAA